MEGEVGVDPPQGEGRRRPQGRPHRRGQVGVVAEDRIGLVGRRGRQDAAVVGPGVGEHALGEHRPVRRQVIGRVDEGVAAGLRRDVGEQHAEVRVDAAAAHGGGGAKRAEGERGHAAGGVEIVARQGARRDQPGRGHVGRPHVRGDDPGRVGGRGLARGRGAGRDHRIAVLGPVAVAEVLDPLVVDELGGHHHMAAVAGEGRAEGQRQLPVLVVALVGDASLGVDLDAGELGVQDEVDHP